MISVTSVFLSAPCVFLFYGHTMVCNSWKKKEKETGKWLKSDLKYIRGKIWHRGIIFFSACPLLFRRILDEVLDICPLKRLFYSISWLPFHLYIKQISFPRFTLLMCVWPKLHVCEPRIKETNKCTFSGSLTEDVHSKLSYGNTWFVGVPAQRGSVILKGYHEYPACCNLLVKLLSDGRWKKWLMPSVVCIAHACLRPSQDNSRVTS